MSPPEAIDRRPLFERIRPTRWSELLGDPYPLRSIREWSNTWATSDRPPRWRAILLSGPPGVGKTTVASVLAAEHGWTVVEMNASEARNQTAIEQVAGRASLTHPLGGSTEYLSPRQGGRSLILLDEVDCMAGRVPSAARSGAAAPNFREFLLGRYATIAALNGAWRLGETGRPAPFSGWAAAPASGGRGAWTRLPEAQRDLAEWKASQAVTDRSDRGGYGAIVRLARTSRQPVVLTANDEYELFRHAGALRGLVLHVRLGPIPPRELAPFLERVARREDISLGPALRDTIVQRSRGDLRAAINDLESIAPLPPGPLPDGLLSVRDLTSQVRDLVGEVLQAPRIYRAGEIRDRADASPEELWPWMEENVPRFAPDPRALDRGLLVVGSGELLVARARRHRVYALWSFASELLTGGAALAIGSERRARFERVEFPLYLARLGQSRAARAVREGILQKIGAHQHLSKRKATETMLPWLESLGQGHPAPGSSADRSRQAIAWEIGLDEAEAHTLGLPFGSEEAAAAPRGADPDPLPPPPSRPKGQRRLGEFGPP